MTYKSYRYPPLRELPPKVTFGWLFKHLPVSVWLALGTSIIGTFGLGVTFGRTTFITELLGKSVPSSGTTAAPQISRDNLNQRIDQLIQGHNESTKSLYKSIAEEEQAAGRSPYLTDSGPHIESSRRLKETLEQKNDAFEQQQKLLREVQK
jgi:hypothetical protein